MSSSSRGADSDAYPRPVRKPPAGFVQPAAVVRRTGRAPRSRAALRVFEGLAGIPAYDDDLDPPAAVRELRRAMEVADAVVIATPEYNASLPGHLKNALDWASTPLPTNPLKDKPVAVVGASTGLFGAVWAQAELRKVLSVIGADVIDRELPVAQADTAFDENGRLNDSGLHSTLLAIVQQLTGASDGADFAESA
ncbi:MAG: NADPH-dependent FMN reductase [Nocardioidaceae bacterium]